MAEPAAPLNVNVQFWPRLEIFLLFVLYELRRFLFVWQFRLEMGIEGENSYRKRLAESAIAATAAGCPAWAEQAGRC
jgi:hypothetical protein